MLSAQEFKKISAELRYTIIQMSQRSEGAHLAGALSVVDILTSLYYHKLKIDPKNPTDANRDRVVFSKGHAVSALYAILAKKGFFPEADLLKYNHEGSHLPEQPSPGCAPGVEWATGSLGHGLGVGSGMAIASRLAKRTNNIYVVMSDGECQEGSVWEAAMFAARNNLNNLTAFVDFNKWQATGRSNEIMEMEPLSQKFAMFGWNAVNVVDGHDVVAICNALDTGRKDATKPLAIICNTIKGKGASFMEDDNNWHYRSPTIEEVEKAGRELGVIV